MTNSHAWRMLFLEGGTQMLICQIVFAICIGVKFGINGDPGHLPKWYAIVVVLFICIYVAGFAWSRGPLGWLVPSEIFPLEITSAAQSINVSVNMFFTFLVAQVFLNVLCHMKFGFFLLFGFFVFVMSLVIYFFLPETKTIRIEEMTIVWKQHRHWSPHVTNADRFKLSTLLWKYIYLCVCDGYGLKLNLTGIKEARHQRRFKRTKMIKMKVKEFKAGSHQNLSFSLMLTNTVPTLNDCKETEEQDMNTMPEQIQKGDDQVKDVPPPLSSLKLTLEQIQKRDDQLRDDQVKDAPPPLSSLELMLEQIQKRDDQVKDAPPSLSSLELMLEQIQKRDDQLRDVPPPLPTRPVIRAQRPKSRSRFPFSFQKNDCKDMSSSLGGSLLDNRSSQVW